MKAINVLIFNIYILITFTPILSNSYLQIALAILWIATSLFLYPYIEKSWKLIIFVWIAYAIILKFIGYSTAEWGNYGIYILFFFPLRVFDVYSKILDQDEKYHIFRWILIVSIANLIYNLYFLINHPSANLELNFSNQYANQNLGNSGFTFVIMLILIYFLYYALKGKKLYIPIVIIGIIYLVFSSKTTAFLIFLIITYAIIVSLFLKHIKKSQQVIVFILGIVILCLAYTYGLEGLATLIKNDYITTRIDALLKGDVSSTYLSRFSLAKLSLHTFANHPIFGIGYVKADFSKISYISTGIGHHSEFIDHLGRYGIIGAIFYCLIFIPYTKDIQATRIEKSDNATIFIMMAFYMYSVLNNSVDAMSGIIIFYFVAAIGQEHYIRFNNSEVECE